MSGSTEASPKVALTAGWTTPLWRMDWGLAGVLVLLVGFGLLMITSASSLSADDRYGDALHFAGRQAMGICAGSVCIGALLYLPWRWLRRSVWPVYLLALVGLCLVFTPMGYTAYAATRWIDLGGVNVQPSEYAKPALIMVLAHYLSANEGRLHDVIGVVFPALALPVPMVVLLMFEPDFGTTVVTVALVGVALFIAGLRWFWVLLGGLISGGVLGFTALLAPYRIRRLTSFMDPYADMEGAGYQVIQGWIAMASGGWTGLGLGAGVAQRGALPEAHNDFISAVVAEELGAAGWIILLLMYIVLVWRGTTIAARSRDLFGTIVASTLTTLLASQAIINLGVVVGVLPAKGLVLPFVSYGASAVVAHLICVGILLRISVESSSPLASAPIRLDASPDPLRTQAGAA